jgi:hypothetical protein
MHLWDRLLPHAVITLNILGTSRINPKLSAATHIFGQYDFNRSPMAPPGTRIIAHYTPNRRRTWAPHGQDGWYIGPALEHFRCYTVYITKTRGERLVETVEFSPEKFTLPFPSALELATQAAVDLTHALLHPQPAGPFFKVGDDQTKALKRLAAIFEGATRQKSKVVLPPPAKWKMLHLRGCKTKFHLRGWQTQLINKCLLNRTYHLTWRQIHRRQRTPARRAVKPPTPHVMVRRSAGQQHNLSHDMIAKTIIQANNCFSISTNQEPKNSTTLNGNDQFIIMPEMANEVICPETGKSLKHQELITKLRYKIKWMRSTSNEINRIYKTNTIRFIRRSNIPKGWKVTYGSFVVDIKDYKEEKGRTRLAAGGDQIEYPGDKSTRTAGLTTEKILINSVSSTLGAKFLVIGIKNFYVNTPLGRFEYMVINLSSLPQEVIDKYDLIKLSQDRKVYIEIQKGMYGLTQAGILANELLQRNLTKDG